MNSQPHRLQRLSFVALAAAAAFGLAACNKTPEPTVGQRVDGAIADTKQASAQAADSMKQGATDAMITTKINAALTADDKLKAIKIDVDTKDGRVTLSGTAPDPTSRERATTLASAVDGVRSVDNRLTVSGG